MGAAEEDLTESSALEECCCGPMFPRESRGLKLSYAECDFGCKHLEFLPNTNRAA